MSTEDKRADKRRKSVDWSAIEVEFKAGIKSTREIGRIFDIAEAAIRHRAKAEGWQKDLSERIRREVRTQITRSELRGAFIDENEIVKAAVITRIDISDAQRIRIRRLTNIADTIITRVEQFKPCDINDMAEAKTACVVLSNATDAVAKLVSMERQAWAMDAPADAGNTSNAADELVKRLAIISARETTD